MTYGTKLTCIYKRDPSKGCLTFITKYPCKNHCLFILNSREDVLHWIWYKLMIPKVLRSDLLKILLLSRPLQEFGEDRPDRAGFCSVLEALLEIR